MSAQIRLPNGFSRRSPRQRDGHRCVSSFCGRLRRDLTSPATAELARRYQTEGVNAYVDLVQNRERELGIDIITHQKWFVSPTLPHQRLHFSSGVNAGVEPIILTES